jgi:hypothetical protein
LDFPARDADAVLASLVGGGTYEDATTLGVRQDEPGTRRGPDLFLRRGPAGARAFLVRFPAVPGG